MGPVEPKWVHITELQILKSFWFGFQIWHQLIFILFFELALVPTQIFLVPFSNLTIISNNAIFQDRLFSLNL